MNRLGRESGADRAPDVDAVTSAAPAGHSAVLAAAEDLVLANKILTAEGVLDAYGHVSVRHPLRDDRFLMSSDCPPVLATTDEVAEYDLDGESVGVAQVPSYSERYIHAAVYACRPDVSAVCHSHAPVLLPFCASPKVPFEIVVHTACVLEGPPTTWDIADDFGSETDLLVTDMQRGHSMAARLGTGSAVLLRSHGSTVVGRDLRQLVVRNLELVRNAQALSAAIALGGEVVAIRPTEIALNAALTSRGSYARQWRYHECRVAGRGL